MAVKNNPQYVKAGGSFSGCPGTALVSGYYNYGESTPVIQGYLNPATGKPWSPTELSDFVSGGGGATTTGTTPATTPATTTPGAQDVSGLTASAQGGWTTSDPYSGEAVQQMLDAGTMPSGGILWGQAGAPSMQQLLTGDYPQVGQAGQAATPSIEEQQALMPSMPSIAAPTLAPAPEVTPAPTFEAPEVPAIPGVTPAPTIAPTEVAPAPEYAPTEEEAAWAEMYGGTIADIIKARGEGIPEETINLMIRQQTQALNAREDENLRLMHNDMERRGITNSGLVFWNQQKIKGATTTALANSITDIQIKSALMKMASFENALGHAGQFLGYLQEQSKMVYTGKMATWEAQTQANLIQYQAQISADMDQWKMTNQFNLADWQANTQALFAQWDKNTTSMIENWKMENQFSITEWGAKADYDMAVFRIETEAQMAEWSAKTDIYKMGINQAYAQDNMNQAAQIAADAAEQQHLDNIAIAQMEIDYAQEAAKAEASGSISGSIVTGAFGLLGAFL